jgi:hypothetical protein
MTQYEQLRTSASQLNGLARATADKNLRLRYLEEALALALSAEELPPDSSGTGISQDSHRSKKPGD